MSGLSVAVLGAGALGTAMALRLASQGVEVHAYNRTPAKLPTLAAQGVHTHSSARSAAQSATHVLCVVTDVAASDAVLFGQDGALVTRPPCRLQAVIDVGTHDPAALTVLAARVEARGVAFVEAPVTGSVHDASHGTLNFLAGGSPQGLALARPLLALLGREVFHLGPVGSGSVAKLAMNQLVGSMAYALGEAIAMLKTQRLDAAMFLSALQGSGLASPLYQRLGQRYLVDDFAARFSLGNLRKDLDLATALASELGCPASAAAVVTAFIGRLDPADHEQDYSLLVRRIAGAA